MNLGSPTFHITAVSRLICSKQNIKCVAEMEDQNISEIKPVLSHHSSARIPQTFFVLPLLQLRILLGDNTDLFRISFHNHFLNGYRKQQIPSLTSETTPSQHIRIPARIPFISYKMRQNKVAQTNKKMKQR